MTLVGRTQGTYDRLDYKMPEDVDHMPMGRKKKS